MHYWLKGTGLLICKCQMAWGWTPLFNKTLLTKFCKVNQLSKKTHWHKFR